MFPMTFDWSQIAYIGSPLVVPFWAAVNVFGGLILVMWVVAPLLCMYDKTAVSANFPLIPNRLHEYILLVLYANSVGGRL